MLALLVFVSTARVDLLFSDNFVYAENAEKGKNLFLSEKKTDANTPENGIKIRFLIGEQNLIFRESSKIFFSERFSESSKTPQFTAFSDKPDYIFSLFVLIFRHYISVNAP